MRDHGHRAGHVVRGHRRQGATVLAESLLALSDDVPPGGWQQQGRSGELAWSILSAPYATGVNSGNAPLLHEVSIAISWADGGSQRQFELQTLRPERRALAGEANQ